MSLKHTPDFQNFLTTYIMDADAEMDTQSTQSFLSSATPEKKQAVAQQAKKARASENLVELLGMEANRWFGDLSEAHDWLDKIILLLDSSSDDSGASAVTVKDSNGTILNEDDSVTVIKDLKVKGGSSDLKRGTLIKKIHLIGDPENIECRVNGSTLVLKTMFLKKST